MYLMLIYFHEKKNCIEKDEKDCKKDFLCI